MIMGDREIGTERRKEAIAAFKEAIKGFPRDKSPFEWALVQFLMSSDILKIGEQELNSEKMEQAEIAARDGLKELSREKTPLRWANAQSILALILRTLGMQETGIVHLKEAESLYREVLQEFTRERVPLEWARAQSDLAVTLQLQGERTGSEKLLEEAKVAYQESLKVFSREKTPEEWANVQINLASTLKLLCIKGARMQMEEVKVTYRESIKKVEEAYRELLKVYDRTETPRLWAQVQIDLGDALEEELFWVSDDNTLLRVFKEASAAYYEALGLFTQDKAPSEWAKIQSRLGDLMSHMGDHIGSYMGSNIVRTYFPPYSIESANFFEGAASAYREALKVYKPENAFFDWADAQLSLGSSLLSLGKTEEAVSVYREALKANFREKHPLEWARMQSNLGNALVTLTLDTRRQNSTSYLKEAVTAYHEALKAYRLSSNISNSSNLWNQSFLEESLGDVLMTLSDREADSSWLEQGIKAYRRSLFIEEQIRAEGDGKRLTREPFQMVILYKKLGNAYSRRGMRENDMGFLLQAVVTYREALKNVIERGSQFDREEVQGNLANVLSELGLRENNIRRFSEALLLYVEVYWGKGLFGLPTIYSQYPGSYALLPSRDRKKMIAYMQQTAVTYREALRKTNREKKLNDWARLKEQLGDTLFIICWWDISGRSCTAHLKEVIDVYLTALKPNPDSPFIYFKLCSAINVRIKSMDEEERASYLEELKGLQKPKGEQAPFVHVIVKETLGNLLSRNGVRHNIKELKEAVAAYREALQEYKLLGLQQQIQNVRISLLHTLISLGERETDADQLEETLILYREEFKELKGREAPYQWEGLGDLLKKLGERRAGTARLEEAEEAYQHALSGLKSSYPTGYGTNYIAKDGDSYNEQIKNKEQIKKIEDKQAVVRELLAKRKK